jgi:outer membrane cobalamin receptor
MRIARTAQVTRSNCQPLFPAKRCVPARLWLIMFLFLALPATAQEGTKDLGEASLEELGTIQVYSASKHMQNASDAPSSVTVITADEIQKCGYRTLADILQSVRGFYITSDRDYSFVGVRGFGRLGDWNPRILLLIDGHRVNNNILGQAMIGTEFLLDVDLIERIEIIRGPNSSLYGADAFFAVINVITRTPPQLKGVELSLTPASFGTYQGRASYGGQYKGIDMLLSGSTTARGKLSFIPSSTTQPPITGSHETRTTKAFSTSWPRSAFMDSPCRAYSAREIREFLRHTSVPCLMTLVPRTSTTINILISATSIPWARTGN